MNPEEAKQTLILVPALLLLGLFGWLYSYGGRQGTTRAWRWLAGGWVLAGGCNGIAAIMGNWHWAMLIGLISYPAALSMGYGADTTWEKVRRRGLFGLLLGLASIPLLAPLGLWMVVATQTIVAVTTSIFMGIKSGTSASGEEATIGVFSTGMVPIAMLTVGG